MSLSDVLSYLPLPLREEIRRVISAPPLGGITPAEIRLRRERIASLSIFRKDRLVNLPLSYVADADALKDCFSRAVGGSLYAFEDSVKEGYLPLPNGIRVGVAGKVYRKSDGTLSMISLDSLVFRLPSGKATADALFRYYRESRGGILLFSPPGGGKTTLLKAFVARAAKEVRVAVIDTREELLVKGDGLLVDRLSGYPKAIGAEIAVRTLSPELLILDELGTAEASALASLVSFGVRTVASTHGEEESDVLRSAALAPLLRSGLFSSLWDVRRDRPLPLDKAI